MRRSFLIFAFAVLLAGPAQRAARAQSPASPPGATPLESTKTIDGVAARIEDDILTESELRELAAFQELVDGRAKPRAELIRELADQWMVRGEADTAKYPQPSQDEVDRAYARFAARFSSPDEFKARCAAVGLSEADIRRMLSKQLYLSRFLDYRFRPAAQVDQSQIEAYYNSEFVAQLKSRNEPVPALDDVEDTIREVLIQRAINDRSAQWLDETRARLRIDVMPQGDRP